MGAPSGEPLVFDGLELGLDRLAEMLRDSARPL